MTLIFQTRPKPNNHSFVFKDSFYEPDYFNEEEENRYLAEHNSPDNNNYMSPTYGNHTDDFSSHMNDNNNDTYGTYSDSKSQLHNNSSKLNRNDSNNNASDIYNYRRTSYDDQHEDKTKLGLNNNSDDYYKMYDDKDKDDRRYEEEFDNEYAQDSVTMSKQMMHKQMSILDEDAHHQDEYMNDKNKIMQNGEQKELDDEYLDEFDEDGMIRRKSDSNSFMKKQESILEDDPELKRLEENHKNQQQHQFQDDKELDQFDLEMKQKKSVSISDEHQVAVHHEKPREARTAKQRWHWAYNRIVHQAQVSDIYYATNQSSMLTKGKAINLESVTKNRTSMTFLPHFFRYESDS